MSAVSTVAARLGQLSGSTYLRTIAVLSSGQMLAAFLPLGAAPILGRLYVPSDYGALAAYMALAGLFGAVSTLQLQQGIIAERSETRARELVLVATLVAGAAALIAALTALAIFVGVAGSETYGDVRAWVLVLPATVLSTGVCAAIAALANRRAAYGALARIPVIGAVATVTTSILFGVMGFGANGLFTSYFLGQAVTLAVHLHVYRVIEPQRPQLRIKRLIAVGWRHRDFVRYTLPSQFLSVISLDMPVYALTATDSIGLLGAFNRARTLVLMPLTLIGGAVAQVFYQRAAEDHRRTGSCRDLYVRTGIALFLAGLPPLAFMMLFAPDLFRLVLGPNWGRPARSLASWHQCCCCAWSARRCRRFFYSRSSKGGPLPDVAHPCSLKCGGSRPNLAAGRIPNMGRWWLFSRLCHLLHTLRPAGWAVATGGSTNRD